MQRPLIVSSAEVCSGETLRSRVELGGSQRDFNRNPFVGDPAFGPQSQRGRIIGVKYTDRNLSSASFERVEILHPAVEQVRAEEIWGCINNLKRSNDP